MYEFVCVMYLCIYLVTLYFDPIDVAAYDHLCEKQPNITRPYAHQMGDMRSGMQGMPCMCVCIHVYMYTYTYIHTYIHIYIYIYIYTHTHMHTVMHAQDVHFSVQIKHVHMAELTSR
jgi:hypothetical protein